MAETIDLGIVGIKNMGEYNSQTNYEKLNVVTYQGSTYCALKNTTGNVPTNTEYWQLYAEKGDTGPQGPKPVKGTDYFTEEDITDIENDLKPTITSDVSDEVTSQLGSLVSATPLVASSVSEMIDTTRIYVNTTNGHWYWYDGTDWQDGGVYQAAEDSDTVEKLQDEVEELNEMLGTYRPNIFDVTDITTDVRVVTTIGYQYQTTTNNAEGRFASNQRWEVKKGDIIYTSSSYTQLVITDENEIIVQHINGPLNEYEITADDAKYLHMGANRQDAQWTTNFMMSINIPLPSVYTPYNALKSIATNVTDHFIEEKNKANTPMIVVTVDPGRGYTEMNSFKNVCDDLGIKCSIGLLTSLMNENTGIDNKTVKELYLDYQSEGFNILSESDSHNSHWSNSDVPDSAFALIEKDVVLSLQKMQTAGFIDYDYIITPNGNHKEKTQQIIEKWAKALLAVGSQVNYGYGDGLYYLKRIFIKIEAQDYDNITEAERTTRYNYYKNIIDQAIAGNGLLIFGVHTLPNNEEYDETLVRNVLQYAISQNIPIYTFNQAYKKRLALYKY